MADKKISALPQAGFLTGSEQVPIVQNGVTVKATTQDIAGLAPSLDFFWSRENTVFSSRIGGSYKLLGINFNNLVLEPGVTYTLLIDRWRYTEVKKPQGPDPILNPQVNRQARFYHEVDPADNGRVNEIVITSTSQFFDFNQDFYFKESPNMYTGFPAPTGFGNKNKNQNAGIVKLGFRIRIDHPTKGTHETPILGSIIMIGTVDFTNQAKAISFKNI